MKRIIRLNLHPYTGAVNPIVPKQKSGTATPRTTLITKSNRNNLDIGILVNQIVDNKSNEIETQSEGDVKQNIQDLTNLKEELRKVKEEREYFQGQFKF
ncbi:hypothetical protein FF38_06790 [Lucilia cuprina]|uniref:Uncharacterized protein n=1 Tax=Lucilia cuprina TaxID=7375 RepID=A0A0L0CLP9_LUCCU|nr:hypothetical protein FF38_06790 [Lucilia cuprina]